jgi:hypothetical protein
MRRERKEVERRRNTDQVMERKKIWEREKEHDNGKKGRR